MAEAPRRDGDDPMSPLPSSDVPRNILDGSVLAHVAASYFQVAKKLERKTGCSATRGFILSTLREGAALNQNQIATMLGIDRTVVHRAVKSMVGEGLISEQPPKSGRAIRLSLTTKGNRYRAKLIETRVAADATIRERLGDGDYATVLRLLDLIGRLEF